ncbi:desumoylating isopeptidase 1 [Nematocida sp. LUAm3]|nr:desumoylating isopeptidase 1 [Nematocida sp. LUAm3]KAI5175813.1 desumoylating isopeptidase 1 [Nematocida sp. LUAm2]KAI5178309.1 desumoylating isopeptidase 1 [Nematocida sp. LUAm1]
MMFMDSIELWVYDLSNGQAEKLFNELLHIDIQGIWHSSVVCNGSEHYFFSGIKKALPGSTHFGAPVKTIPFGKSEKTPQELQKYLEANDHRFTDATYDLFLHNCNHFSNDLLKFLVNQEIPIYIMEPAILLQNNPIGEMVKQLISSAQLQDKEE